MIWATTNTSKSGKAHNWYDPKNTSSPDIRVSYCGRISRKGRLQPEDGIGQCRICAKQSPPQNCLTKEK